MANSNSFLSPYKFFPIAQENKYLRKFSYFIMKLYVMYSQNCLIKLMLMSALNIPFLSRRSKKKSLHYCHLLPDLASWLTLSGLNYPYLKEMSMVLKMFKPLRFNCTCICIWKALKCSYKQVSSLEEYFIYAFHPAFGPVNFIKQIESFTIFVIVDTALFLKQHTLYQYIFLTLVLLNPDISCLCKQWRSRSVGFWRSQMIWICTVCHSVCEFISTIWIKLSEWLKIRNGHGILIYSAGQGLTI